MELAEKVWNKKQPIQISNCLASFSYGRASAHAIVANGKYCVLELSCDRNTAFGLVDRGGYDSGSDLGIISGRIQPEYVNRMLEPLPVFSLKKK